MPATGSAAWPNPEPSIGRESLLLRQSRKKIWEATGPALQKFENEIFKAINDLLDAHKEHLESGEQISRTYSFHLWMVGREVERAVPTIIFTSKSAKLRDKVTKLIKKHDILDNYPGFALNSMDRMPAVPMGPLPPETEALGPEDRLSITEGAAVYVLRESIDVCGTLVSVGDNEETTLGGTIVIREEYYGFIALHPREDNAGDAESIICRESELRLDYESDIASTATASLRPSASLRSARNSILDLSRTNTSTILDKEKNYTWSGVNREWGGGSKISLAPSTRSNISTNDPERLIEPRQIGTIVTVSTRNGLRYGIFRIEDPRYWIPNRIPLPFDSPGGRLYLYPKEVTSEVQEGEAWIAAGKSGPIKGTIIQNPYFIKMAGSENYQKMWPIQLERDIVPGDCGSWVVETQSGKLVGHVVAGDPALHRAFFIQAIDVFEDIRIKMGASVLLPVPPICSDALILSRSYARAVTSISKETSSDSLYPGANYLALAEYLSRPERFNALSQSTTPKPGISTHILVHEWYNLDHKASNFRDLADFHWYASTRAATRQNSLIFLSGVSSPEWLRALGAAYSVDPDFFQVHLNSIQNQKREDNLNMPSLPSPPSSTKVLRLRLTTQGKMQTTAFESTTAWGKHCTESMQRYLNNLQPLKGLPVGTSMVRNLSCFRDGVFALEQEMSVAIIEHQVKWTVLVWSDVGQPLDHASGLWTELFPPRRIMHRGHLLPIVQPRPWNGIDAQASFDANPARAHSDTWAQSAAVLPSKYGKLLRTDIMQQDPLYAISDLLRFASCSEVQFLNMLDCQISLVSDTLRDNLDGGSGSLLGITKERITELEYIKTVLLHHMRRLEENLAFIKAYIGVDRKLTGELEPNGEAIADATTRSIIKDFEYLLKRAEGLKALCETSAVSLMNRLMIREAQVAISQASSVKSFTVLAILFLPGSFIASLLGMNIDLLSAGPRIFEMFWAITIPVTVCSILVFWMTWHGSPTWSWKGISRLLKKKIP